MDNPKVESCTQIEVRYCLQFQIDNPQKSWVNHWNFFKGFKLVKSAFRALERVKDGQSNPMKYRIVKQTRTIEIKTTTVIEVLNEN